VRPLGSEGAFSPDGRRLALAVTRAGRQQAAIVDLATRRWTLVPGGAMRDYGAIAWSPSGRWLYFAGPDRGLFAWQAGAADAARLPIDAHGTVLSIAVAG
jgi:Tol biopolymer transport system component